MYCVSQVPIYNIQTVGFIYLKELERLNTLGDVQIQQHQDHWNSWAKTNRWEDSKPLNKAKEDRMDQEMVTEM